MVVINRRPPRIAQIDNSAAAQQQAAGKDVSMIVGRVSMPVGRKECEHREGL